MNLLTDAGVDLPDAAQLFRVVFRLVAAAVFGGLLGLERERMGKDAGLRTHMLVALGAAMFMVVPAELGLADGDLGRIVQGVAAGIGFIGAGTILKKTDEEQVKGLTTAGSIWLTAGIGLATGAGLVWLALVAAACAWVILWVLGQVERQVRGESGRSKDRRHDGRQV